MNYQERGKAVEHKKVTATSRGSRTSRSTRSHTLRLAPQGARPFIHKGRSPGALRPGRPEHLDKRAKGKSDK